MKVATKCRLYVYNRQQIKKEAHKKRNHWLLNKLHMSRVMFAPWTSLFPTQHCSTLFMKSSIWMIPPTSQMINYWLSLGCPASSDWLLFTVDCMLHVLLNKYSFYAVTAAATTYQFGGGRKLHVAEKNWSRIYKLLSIIYSQSTFHLTLGCLLTCFLQLNNPLITILSMN